MTWQAQALYRLQTIDLQTLDHQKRLTAITAQLADSEAIATAQAVVDQASATLKPLRAESRDLELEMQANAQKTKNSEDRLYSGAIKNPKEMQDVQNEIESLKKRNSQLEDQALELMIAIEDAEATLHNAEAALKTITAGWESQHSDLAAEKAEREAQIAALQAEREAALADVTPQNRKLYDTMKGRKANRPVSVMQGRLCTACGVEQTLAIETEVRRRAGLVNCENCGRILVF